MKHWNIDIEELRKLWDADWSVADLSKRFGCTESMVYVLSNRHNFRRRDALQSREPPPPSPEDATASFTSLELSPWVAERAAPYRREKEARGEPVYGAVFLKTYSLRTLRAVSD